MRTLFDGRVLKLSKKTRIRKGEIVQEIVWTDESGNEFEKLSDNPATFSPKQSAATSMEQMKKSDPLLMWVYKMFRSQNKESEKLHQQHVYEPVRRTREHTDLSDYNLGLVVLVTALLAVTMLGWFCIGYLLGQKRLLLQLNNTLVSSFLTFENKTTNMVANVVHMPQTPEQLDHAQEHHSQEQHLQTLEHHMQDTGSVVQQTA